MHGEHITGSPFKARAEHGKITPSECEVRSAPKTVVVGHTSKFEIVAKDQVPAHHSLLHRFERLSSDEHSCFTSTIPFELSLPARLFQLFFDVLVKASRALASAHVLKELAFKYPNADAPRPFLCKRACGRNAEFLLEAKYSLSTSTYSPFSSSSSFAIALPSLPSSCPSLPSLCPSQAGHLASYTPLCSSGYKFTISVSAVGEAAVAVNNSLVAKNKEPINTITAASTDATAASTFTRSASANRTTSTASTAASATATSTGTTAVDVHDRGDGVHVVSLRLTVAGRYTLVVLGHDGVEVKGSPLSLSALAAKMEVRTCVMAGDGLAEAEAGTPTQFTITPLDRFGNHCVTSEEGGAPFKLRLLNTAREHEVLGKVEPVDGGLFVGKYTVRTAGEYKMEVLYHEAHLQGSPFSVRVLPAPTHTGSCIRLFAQSEDEPLADAVAGIESSFEISARDAFGNVRLGGGETFLG
eukprot:1776812-Pleurochrysis_carterae.AAC.1